MSNDNIRIYLVDDHKILRESLEMLLSAEDDMEVIGQSDNGLGLENTFGELENVDLLLMDISMPKRDGFDTSVAMKRLYPELKIVFLTMHKSEEMLSQAFESGASGYVLKENAFEELTQAIHKVMQGDVYVSAELTPMMLNGFLTSERGNQDMSSRERSILKLLAEGCSNKEIADILSISVKTVETHRANIMKKNGFKNITELVLYAVRNHIVEP